MNEFDEKKLEQAESFYLNFGKYRGQKLKTVPNYYIKWLAENSKNESLAEYADIIRRWRERYGIEIE